jgi:hypothetical protein
VQAFIPRSWGLDRGPWQDRYRTRSDSCWDEQRDLKGMRLIFFLQRQSMHVALPQCMSGMLVLLVHDNRDV